MGQGRLLVVVTRHLPPVVETRLKELFDVELRDPDTVMTREELAEAMSRCDVLVPTVTDRIEGAVGRDLQFIRINGTLVGGLVGLALHALDLAL